MLKSKVLRKYENNQLGLAFFGLAVSDVFHTFLHTFIPNQRHLTEMLMRLSLLVQTDYQNLEWVEQTECRNSEFFFP